VSTFELRAGDNSVAIEIQLTRRDGTLQPLAGSETGSFIFSTWIGADVLTKALAVSDAPNSKVKCTFPLAADTSGLKGQVLRLRVPVTFAGGGSETYPTAPDDLLVVFY
jgi:hypothetical protein